MARELDPERYEAAFRENRIDWALLPKLTADDLRDLGVSLVGHRRKLLEAIADLSAADAPAAPISPQRKKERTLAALLRQLQALVLRQPVLMIFEDLHWLDPTSREVLDLTVERITGLPVLLVATYRSEFPTALDQRGAPPAAEYLLKHACRSALSKVEYLRTIHVIPEKPCLLRRGDNRMALAWAPDCV